MTLIALAVIGGAIAISGTVSRAFAGTPVAHVTAVEREYSISPRNLRVRHGRVAILVRNAGAIPHALSITGPGLAETSTPNVAPGGTATLAVRLPHAGRYTLWCPIPGHRAAGMVATLVAT